jgi:hypothetical protein
MSGDATITKAIAVHAHALLHKTSEQWSLLSSTCLRLALLAHKQLDGKAFSKTESGWLKRIGTQFAMCMHYEGNSYLTPLDDAARVARISSDPRDGSVKHAGIGRPRFLYVLYPWAGKEVLCRGVVMPYHEVTDRKTLTDAEWRKEFEKDTRPAAPAWLRDFVPVDGVKLGKSGED